MESESNFHFESFTLTNSKVECSENNKTLALFNFFGTLAWGIDGKLFNYNSITPSSPHIAEKFRQLHKSGYTICIIEYMGKNKIEEYKKLLTAFYEIFKNPLYEIHCIVLTNKKHYDYLLDDLILYFNPKDSVFGDKSFYCGDEVSCKNHNPFFRHSDRDYLISKKLNFRFFDPYSVLQNYENNKLIIKDFRLIITYGHENSGMEMDYESEREDNKFDNIPCKIKVLDSMKQCLIKSNDLFKEDLKEKINIPEDMTFIVYGSHPTFEERERIRKYFNYDSEIIYWYSRPPYKKSEKYEYFLDKHDHPSNYMEKFIRIH
jgi:hypothetical protein